MSVNKREFYVTDEEFFREKDDTDQIWNAATISGLIILFLTSVYLLQAVFGIHWGPDMTSIIDIIPVIGGFLLITVGFGYLTGSQKENREEAYLLHNDIECESSKNQGYFDDSATEDYSESYEYSNYRGNYSGYTAGAGSDPGPEIDPYAMRQRKKLFKSRTDKKISGVCGGLGAYFDVSSTVIRLLFVILTLVGVGSALILYIIFWIVLEKEPAERTKKVHVQGR